MKRYLYSQAITCLLLFLTATSTFAEEQGLVADYAFRSSGGGETTLEDDSANANNGSIHGASWGRETKGFRLNFDGEDDYVDCGEAPTLDLQKSVTVEAWVKPKTDPGVDVGIAGKHIANFALTMYKGQYWWYISSGGNNIQSPANIGSWQHVVGTFDGQDMKLYIDGKLVASRESKFPYIHKGTNLFIGCIAGDASAKDPAERQSGHFHGAIGRVRIYNQALSSEQIEKHYLDEAEQFIDNAKLNQLHVTAYPYFNKDMIIAEIDYSSLLSVPENASFQVELLKAGQTQVITTQQVSASVNTTRVEAYLPGNALEPGNYILRASIGDKEAEYEFNYTGIPAHAPSPERVIASPFPKPLQPVPYDFTLSNGGSFSLEIGGEVYPFESCYSYPYGGENKLIVSDAPSSEGEKWDVIVQAKDSTTYSVQASGKYYILDRLITLHPNRIAIQDTFTNRTEEPLGIIIRNHLKTEGKQLTKSYLAGFPSTGVRRDEHSPSVFVGKDNLGIGIIPIDDLYIIQGELYNKQNLAGIATDKFALDTKASYTLEWAIYPNGTGDYYDFINAFRQDEGRIGTVEGGLDFVTQSMQDRNLRTSPTFVESRNLKYGVMPCLDDIADDPQLSIEGIEFMDFPEEMAVIKKTMTELHTSYPEVQGMFHVAHSLYLTDRPDEKFPDSRVILPDGKPAFWPDNGYGYISKERQDAGWQWWIFYPTPGNSFHDAMMKSVDVMMDELGSRGVFTDGLLNAYMGAYTFDRWDGHSAQIDPVTKTIERKMGSVLLLSQPSIIEYVRRVNDKGGTVIANNSIMTRSFAREKTIVNREVIGPASHLAPTSVCLGTPPVYLEDSTALYRDILDTLNYGSLYFLYGVGPEMTDDSLAAHLYPMTFEEIRSGIVKGPERIVTSRSGIYGWPETRDIAMIYHFDGRGVRVPHNFITTVDASEVRTQVRLDVNESAVLERIPVAITVQNPANVLCKEYGNDTILLNLNGNGKATLTISDGRFPIARDKTYQVKADTQTFEVVADENNELIIPLDLRPEVEVKIAPLMQSNNEKNDCHM